MLKHRVGTQKTDTQNIVNSKRQDLFKTETLFIRDYNILSCGPCECLHFKFLSFDCHSLEVLHSDNVWISNVLLLQVAFSPDVEDKYSHSIRDINLFLIKDAVPEEKLNEFTKYLMVETLAQITDLQPVWALK